MILTLIIILLLFVAFKHGATRGFLAVSVKLIGFIALMVLSLWFAPSVGQSLADLFRSLGVQLIFYQILAFWLIMLVGGILLRFVTVTLKKTTRRLPVISHVDRLLGGIVSFLMMYGVLFFGLLLGSVWPTPTPKEMILDSSGAQFILKKTPIISQEIYSHWLEQPELTVL
ncbi:CvpA family protein [Ligilactobacillus faecis]|uniref:CvpA family protein n=1 Tax=Ligilactobacillus faecis TaxID=762833 RepID=A0ABV4DRW8_9LACO